MARREGAGAGGKELEGAGRELDQERRSRRVAAWPEGKEHGQDGRSFARKEGAGVKREGARGKKQGQEGRIRDRRGASESR